MDHSFVAWLLTTYLLSRSWEGGRRKGGKKKEGREKEGSEGGREREEGSRKRDEGGRVGESKGRKNGGREYVCILVGILVCEGTCLLTYLH